MRWYYKCKNKKMEIFALLAGTLTYVQRSELHMMPMHLALQVVIFYKIFLVLFCQNPPAKSGASNPPKAGTDVLLDLLSIGTSLPAGNSSSTSDILSSSQDNKAPLANLNGLASLSSVSENAVFPASSAAVMDLLDELGPGPQKHEENSQAYPSLVAFESSSLGMGFTFKATREPSNNVDPGYFNRSFM